MSDDEMAAGFKELRWQESVPFDKYLEQVAETRRTGWGLDEGNFIRGVTTIAVPVFDKRGAISNCLSATMFTGQYPRSEHSGIAKELQQIAQWASQLVWTPMSQNLMLRRWPIPCAR